MKKRTYTNKNNRRKHQCVNFNATHWCFFLFSFIIITKTHMSHTFYKMTVFVCHVFLLPTHAKLYPTNNTAPVGNPYGAVVELIQFRGNHVSLRFLTDRGRQMREFVAILFRWGCYAHQNQTLSL